MTWSWSYDVEPTAAVPVQDTFGSQSDAESWIGEQWRELAAAGVQHVTLLDDGATVYRMSLEQVG